MEPNTQPGSERAGHRSRGSYHYRSLFWAIVIIAVGVVWLLANFDVVSIEQLSTLVRLWPILLVGVGVDLLVGHRSLHLGALVGALTVGLIIVLMVVGPSLGWAEDTTVKEQTFAAAVGQATSARVEIGLNGYSATIHALDRGQAADPSLIVAEGSYVGTVDFTTTGETDKTVILKAHRGFWGWRWFGEKAEPGWDVGLDALLPTYLVVDSSSGKKTLDLAKLQLTGLECDLSSGEMEVALPSTAQPIPVALQVSSGDLAVDAPARAKMDMRVEVSSGDAKVALAQDSDVTVHIRISSGQITLNLPEGAALRVEVQNVSSGDVGVPSGITRLEGGDGDEGTWETPGFAGATNRVNVIVENVSSGSVDIRQGG
jgi:hypothetical protein